MVKKDIVKSISIKLGIDEDDIRIIINTFMDEVTRFISLGNNIYLRGFGTFYIKKIKSRRNFNIRADKNIVQPDKKKLVFKAGKKILEKVAELD